MNKKQAKHMKPFKPCQNTDCYKFNEWFSHNCSEFQYPEENLKKLCSLYKSKTKESAWEMFRELIKNNEQLVFETFNLGWDNLPPEKEAIKIMKEIEKEIENG